RSDCIARRPASHSQLPVGSVSQLNGLRTQLELPAGARGQVDRAHGHLRRKTEQVRSPRTVRRDDLALGAAEGLNHRLDGWRPLAEAGLYRPDIEASTGTQELPSLRQPGQSLVQ